MEMEKRPIKRKWGMEMRMRNGNESGNENMKMDNKKWE